MFKKYFAFLKDVGSITQGTEPRIFDLLSAVTQNYKESGLAEW